MPILCLGEALVDLVAPGSRPDELEGSAFAPHFGGALANAAVAAARAGAEVELAGGVGDDELGDWLRSRLSEEGVGQRWLARLPVAATAVVLIRFGPDREPRFSVYGDSIEAGIVAAGERLEEALAACSALAVGSNTLVGEREREITIGAVEAVASAGKPVLFDPNLRLGRWRSPELARELCLDLARRAFAVRTNLSEGAWLAGLGEAGAEHDPAADIAVRAAEQLAGLGVAVAVVTRGAAGAVLRGAAEAEHPGVEVELVSPLGAGDAFTGTLAAGLAAAGWDPGRAAEALPASVEAGARACTVWEAVPPR